MTRGHHEHRTRKRRPDRHYKVLRTNRLRSNCALSECFWYDKKAHPKLYELVSIDGRSSVGSSRLSCFNSLTRRLFVSNSHVGRMCTQYDTFVGYMALRPIVRNIRLRAEPFLAQASIRRSRGRGKLITRECQS
jgi:hypothetical protein